MLALRNSPVCIRRSLYLLSLLTLGFLPVGAAFGDSLVKGFANPPSEAKSRVWWHWMNGNVTKAGITADLEAMAAAGIGGAHIFDVGCNVPPGPVKFNTPSWDEHIRFAAAEAERLGLELTLVNCSGYANAGGPWISASNSMFFVTYTETEVAGGSRFTGKLPRCTADCGFYRDIAVLAFPKLPAECAAPKDLQVRQLGDNAYEISAAEPFTLHGLEFSLKLNAWAWNRWMDLVIETSDDGKAWREALRCDDLVASGGKSDCTDDLKYMAFPRAVTGRRVRITADFDSQKHPPRPGAVFRVFRPAFKSGLPHLNGRTFRTHDTHLVALSAEILAAEAVDPARIVDLTERLRPDGTLVWDAPAGDWVVLRVGYRSNGVGNHPSSEFGGGFEVDKLDAEAVARHFDAYVGRFADLKAIVAMLCDSYEVGPQNWTHGFERRFAARYGYSLLPYLVAFSGRVVESAARTDAVLRDFRRLVSDEFASCFMGTLRRKCAEHGISSAVECYGNGPVETLAWSRNADIPMTEFWVAADAGAADVPNRLQHMLCAKAAASDAHLLGKRFVDAEGFTAHPTRGGRWLKDPFGLKPFGDAMYCVGVNRMVFHRFAHQPWTDPARLPGMTMGQWGTHFERTETWWPMVGPFLRYQARCQFMLQQGLSVCDLLCFVGDEVPVSATPEVDHQDGYDWDVCNGEILSRLTVRDGRIAAPGGTDYAVLVAPTNRLVSADSRRQFARLSAQGARVVSSADPLGFAPDFRFSGTSAHLRSIHRRTADGRHFYFVASPSTNAVSATCSFRMAAGFPQIWNPEDGLRFRPRDWKRVGERVDVVVNFPPCGAFFVLFAEGEDSTVPVERQDRVLQCETVNGPWTLTFPDGWRCPKSLSLDRLVSWTDIKEGEVRYFSGIATYERRIAAEALRVSPGERVWLDLGDVRNLAEVTVNGTTYPALWRPPFRVDITDAIKAVPGDCALSIRVANLWPNRLIGDEQLPEDREWNADGVSLKRLPDWVLQGKPSPTGRLTFTTWHHWRKDEPLLESGLLGPVRIERTRD